MKFVKLFLGLLLNILIFNNCVVAQIYYYPEQNKKGKWGIKRSDNGPVSKGEKVKWLFEPKWDIVYKDTADYFCKNSTYCDRFITELNGKLGCVWAISGVQLDNLYDEIDITHKRIKLNSKLAALAKEKIITGFDYDDLFTCNTPQTDAYNKTYGFCVKQNGKWGVIFVDIGKPVSNNISTIVPFEYDDYKTWVNGVILSKNNQWSWFNTQNSVKSVPAFTCDSLIKNGPFWIVRKNNQWGILNDFPGLYMITKPWDKIEPIPNTEIYLVHKKANKGLIRLTSKFDRLREELIIPVNFSNIKAEKAIDGSLVFVCENGSENSIYDHEGKLLNNTGNVNISSSIVTGPFKRNELRDKDLYGKTKTQVVDNATGNILYEESGVNLVYKLDNDLGHILEVAKYEGNSWKNQGIYHYNSKQYIQCNNGFKKLNGNYFLFTNNTDIVIYSLNNFKKIETPFTIARVREGNDPLIQDVHSVWHKLDSKFTIISGDSVLKNAVTLFAGIVIHEMESGKIMLFSLNGKKMNETISSYKWIIQDHLISIVKNGSEQLYLNYANTIVLCKFNTVDINRSFAYMLSNGSWKSQTQRIPLALIDSANYLLVVNLYNNERWSLPQPTEPKVIFWNKAKILTVNPFEDVIFSTEETGKCTICKDGYISAGTGTRTIKGTTSYKTVKEYEEKKETERVWDARTNSYKYVTKYRTVPFYKTIETKNPDRTETYQKTVVCSQCNGKKSYMKESFFVWNGKSLSTPVSAQKKGF